MNWFDLVLFALLIGGLAVGYSQGLWRQVLGLAAMYLGAIVASQYYFSLGAALQGSMKTTPGLALHAVAFFIIMFLVMAILNYFALDATKMITRLPSLIDHLGGMVLGLAATWILLTVIVSILPVMTISEWPGAEGAREVISVGVRDSILAHTVQSNLPMVLSSLKPWLPGGIPNIFSF